MFYDGYLHVKYILSENVFSYKIIFCYLFATLKILWKTFFSFWLIWKIAKYFLYFHIICKIAMKRETTKKSCREKVSVKIKSIQWWDWNPLQLHVHIASNLNRQLLDSPLRGRSHNHLLGVWKSLINSKHFQVDQYFTSRQTLKNK
jgi:hypothetical protein